jgi:NADH-quinone oxidoreductase subunit L
MSGPLVILAVGAVFAGYVGVHFAGGGFLGFLEPGGAFHRFLEPVVEPYAALQGHHEVAHAGGAEHGIFAAIAHHWLMYLSAFIAIVGAWVAYVFYVSRPWIPHVIRSTYGEAYRVLRNKYYVDEAYDKAFVRPLRESGVAAFRFDEFVIDGLLWVITAVPRLVGYIFRGMQGGALQGYGLGMAAGLAIMILLALLVR